MREGDAMSGEGLIIEGISTRRDERDSAKRARGKRAGVSRIGTVLSSALTLVGEGGGWQDVPERSQACVCCRHSTVSCRESWPTMLPSHDTQLVRQTALRYTIK